MTNPLGLSIGTTNLVAARVGGQSTIRRAVLTLPTHGVPQVGVSTGDDGLVFVGFVERVGDPVPLVASDGSSFAAEDLLTEALEALAGVDGLPPSAQTAIAVPAHWTPATLRTLRAAIRSNPVLAVDGNPPRLVSDAVAALTALRTESGLTGTGPVLLLDFGGGGTSITLADGGAGFAPLDETLRVSEFSGDLIDQALLSAVLGHVSGDDPGATAAVEALGALREECRQAKERLSTETATDVPVDGTAIRFTRAELDALLAEPLTEVLTAVDNLLQRNRITFSDLSALAISGGGAHIPLITQRLSERSGMPVVATAQPALDAAEGAALFAAYGAESDMRTGLAPALSADAPTGLAPAVADDATQMAPAGQESVGALAWSQDDDAMGEPVPYTGEDPYVGVNPYTTDSTTRVVAQQIPSPYEDRTPTWQRLPILIFAGAGVLTLVALGGVAIALTGSSGAPDTPTPTNAPVSHALTPPPAEAPPPAAVAPSASPPPPPVVTVTTELPPPPPQTITEAPVVTTTHTTTQPTTTTTTTTTTTATTTTTTPSTTTTTTTTPSTTTTTTPSTTTTTTVPTTTTTTTVPAMTTTFITVPFVPVPIPIQVPNRGQPTYP